MKLLILIALSFCLHTIGFAQEQSISKPFILGEIHQVSSQVLHEQRTINVYLPEGYDVSGKETYSVIYLLDGSKDEDFIHTVGLVQYNTFSWVNRMPKSIVIGISNIDRKRDFTFPTMNKEDKKQFPTTGGSNAFIEFMEKELKPYVNTTFKTNGQSTLIGQSLGGLLATEILITQPTLYTNYIIISPSIWWNDKSILKEVASLKGKVKKKSINVYIGVGKEGHGKGTTGSSMEADAKELFNKLSKIKGVKSTYDFLPKETHATVGHQSLSNAFMWLYN